MRITGADALSPMALGIPMDAVEWSEGRLVSTWVAEDAAAAANQVAARYASNPRVTVQVGVRATGHNRAAVMARVNAPDSGVVSRIEREITAAVAKAVDDAVAEMRRIGFSQARVGR